MDEAARLVAVERLLAEARRLTALKFLSAYPSDQQLAGSKATG
jgi:hypothetical protein